MIDINGSTKIFGLIGNPVEHTLSPLIHNQLAALMGYNMAYVPFLVTDGKTMTASAALAAAIPGAFTLGIGGLNITVPYKSAVLPLLERVEAPAAAIGAVNTLVRGENGYIGYNTDAEGLYRAMQDDGININNEAVIVLGAGGAARAAAFMAAFKGAAAVVIMNRAAAKATALAAEINKVTARECAAGGALADFKALPARKHLVIQATSVGLNEPADRAVIADPAFYQLVHTGYELIYRPSETMFMNLTRQAGGRAYNGLKMLLYQAVQAFELWHQTAVPPAVAAQVYRELQDINIKAASPVNRRYAGEEA